MSYPPGYFGFGQQLDSQATGRFNPFGLAGMQQPRSAPLQSSLLPMAGMPQGTILGAAPERADEVTAPPMDLGITDAQTAAKRSAQAVKRASDPLNVPGKITLGDRAPAPATPLAPGSSVADAPASGGLFAGMTGMDVASIGANTLISALPGSEANNQWGVTKTASNIALNPALMAATGGLSAAAVPVAAMADMMIGQDNQGKSAVAKQQVGEDRWNAQADNTPYDGTGYRQGASGWFQNTRGMMGAAEGGPIPSQPKSIPDPRKFQQRPFSMIQAGQLVRGVLPWMQDRFIPAQENEGLFERIESDDIRIKKDLSGWEPVQYPVYTRPADNRFGMMGPKGRYADGGPVKEYANGGPTDPPSLTTRISMAPSAKRTPVLGTSMPLDRMVHYQMALPINSLAGRTPAPGIPNQAPSPMLLPVSAQNPDFTAITPHASSPKLNYLRLEAPTTPNIQRANTLMKTRGIIEPRMANGGESNAGHVIPAEKVEEARQHAKRAGIAKLVDRPAFMNGEAEGGIIPGDGSPKADDKFFRPADGEPIKISSGEMYVSAENFAKMALAAGMDQDEYAQHMYPNSEHAPDAALAEGGPVGKPTVPAAYQDHWNAMLEKYGLQDQNDVLVNLVQQESGWRADAVGPKTKYGNAKGLFQFIDPTAKEMGIDATDPYQNIEGGMRYFKQNLDMFGDPKLAVAAHHAGPGAVKKAGGIPKTFDQAAGISTANYVKAITDSAEASIERPAPAVETPKTIAAPAAQPMRATGAVDPGTFQQSRTNMNEANERLQSLHGRMYGRADGGPVSNAGTPFAGMGPAQIRETYQKNMDLLNRYKGFDMGQGSVYHGPEVDKQYHDAYMMRDWLLNPVRQPQSADANQLNMFGIDVSLPGMREAAPTGGVIPSRFDWGSPNAHRTLPTETVNTDNGGSAGSSGQGGSNGYAGQGGGNTYLGPPTEEQMLGTPPPAQPRRQPMALGAPPQMDLEGMQKLYDQSALLQVAPVVASGVYNALSKPTLMNAPAGLQGEFVDLGTDAMRADLDNRRSTALNTAVLNNRGNQNPAIGMALAADYQQAGIQGAAAIQQVQNQEAAMNNPTANRVNAANWQAQMNVEGQNTAATNEHRMRKGIALSENATNLGRIGATLVNNRIMGKLAAGERASNDYWRNAFLNVQTPTFGSYG